MVGDPAEPVREGYRLEKASIRASPADRKKQDPPWFPSHRKRIFSDRMVRGFEMADRAFEKDQTLTFGADPFLAAQHYQDDVLHDLVIEVRSATPTSAVVSARFANIEPTETRFDVVLERGRWVIDDIDSLAVALGVR